MMIKQWFLKYFFFILFLPIILNALFNLKLSELGVTLVSINFYDAVSSILLFILLFAIGSVVKLVLGIETVSFGIVVFLFSFFILDALILFFYNQLTFSQIFLIVNLIWIGIFINKKYYFRTFKTILIYITVNIFNNTYIDQISKNRNIIGDVEMYFFPHAKNIYEKSYYYSVNNFITEGYPQFTSYLQALIQRFSFDSEIFQYLSPTTQVMFLLSILFFTEIKTITINKLLLILLYSSLILNSGWLKFLFTSSLMSEGIVSLFSAVILYEIITHKKESSLVFCMMGMLYLTKQFLSLIVILYILYRFFTEKNFKLLTFGFFGIILKEALFLIVFKGLSSSHHLSQIDVFETFIDLITFSDLKLNNIVLIVENLYRDKPLSILLIGLSLSYIIQIILKRRLKDDIHVYIFIIFCNIVFVILIYISAWQNMEYESSTRYILSFLHLKIITIPLLVKLDD